MSTESSEACFCSEGPSSFGDLRSDFLAEAERFSGGKIPTVRRVAIVFRQKNAFERLRFSRGVPAEMAVFTAMVVAGGSQ